MKVAGLMMSFATLVFSAFGNVLSKLLKGKIAKQDLSAYIGVSIFLCSLGTSFLAEPLMWLKEDQKGIERYVRYLLVKIPTVFPILAGIFGLFSGF